MMMRQILPSALSVLVTLFIVVCFWWYWCGQQTTVLLVRHADRGTQDQLSAAGLARAQELVHVGEKAGIQAIYQTEFQRTRQTAEPLASALGLTPIEIPAADARGLADHIRQNQRGRTVLVIGHSDSVPLVIGALGGPVLPNIDGDEFDNLFMLSICGCERRSAKLVNLQYGVGSP
jgi:broad specificity phosphatase PhoE